MLNHVTECRRFNLQRTLQGHAYVCVCPGPLVKSDEVNHPSHYTSHAGVECIDIAETMTFNRGNALKYVWRAGLKSDDVVKDLKKAVWYLNREIGRLQKLNGEEDKPEEHRTAVTPTINGLGEAPGELAARFHSGG